MLAVNSNYVKVLTSVAKIGRKATRNKVVTFTFTAKTKRTAKKHAAQLAHDAASPAPASPAPAAATAPALAPGTDIVAAGIVSSNGTLVKTNEVSTVLPAEALIGKVSTVNADGSFIVAIHDQVDGDHAEHDNNDGVIGLRAGRDCDRPGPGRW